MTEWWFIYSIDRDDSNRTINIARICIYTKNINVQILTKFDAHLFSLWNILHYYSMYRLIAFMPVVLGWINAIKNHRIYDGFELDYLMGAYY